MPATPSSRRRRTTRSRRPIPAIIAETRVDIPEASVSDAVMLMDLRNTNALMFRNSGSGRVQHGLPTRRRNHRLGRTARQVTSPAFRNGAQHACAALRARSAKCPMHDLSEFLDFEAIRVDLPAATSARCSAAGAARRRSGWRSIRRCSSSLAERERLGSTGFGGGVAIPHGKIEGLTASIACSRGSATPVDYKAIDGGRSISSSCCCRRPMPGPSI